MNADTVKTKENGLAEAGYGRSATVWISPRLLRWVVPTAVVAIFVLLFLPWTGAYPSGYPAYTQNAFQTIWGGVSVNPIATSALDSAKPFDKIEKNPFMLLYILFIVFAILLILAPLVVSASRVQTFRPIVQSLWQRREGFLRTMAFGSFVVLMVQLWVGFGFEAAVAAKADTIKAVELVGAKTAEGARRRISTADSTSVH